MRKWWPLVAVCLGTLMLMVDTTVVIVALPSMASDLNASFADLQWVIDGYALTLAALLLSIGSLADRFGRRRLYLAGLILFAVSSLSCALSPSIEVLIASRAVQGIGGAAMLATTMALLTSEYSGRDRGVAFGMWGAVSGASAAAGPILGGLLTEYVNWQAIFLINLPLCAVTVLLSRFVLAESRNPDAGRLDVGGMLTFTLAAGCVTYGLIRGSDNGWTSATTLVLFGVAAAALLTFILVESRRRDPMLDLSLFRSRSFAVLLAAAMLLQAGAFGYLTYTSLWLQSVLGAGPVRAGLTGSMALSVAGFLVSALAGRFLHGISPKLPVGIGMLVLAVGNLLQSGLTGSSGGTHLLPGLIVAGIGMGLSVPTVASAVMAAVPGHRAGMAGGALNTFRQLGMALGIAVLGVVLRAGLETSLRGNAPDPHGTASALAAGRSHAILAHLSAGARGSMDRLVHDAFATAVNHTLVASAMMAAVGGILVLLLVPRRGPTSKTDRQPAARATASV